MYFIIRLSEISGNKLNLADPTYFSTGNVASSVVPDTFGRNKTLKRRFPQQGASGGGTRSDSVEIGPGIHRDPTSLRDTF